MLIKITGTLNDNFSDEVQPIPKFTLDKEEKDKHLA